MRWASQNVDADDAARLPGLQDTVIRRFDAPEALGTRFHEIRTKSALNHVPGGTRGLPFEWTINPYRGCSHACVYCAAPDTPVLMSDGRASPISDLRVGDEIYGTLRDGADRRYVKTHVLAHWSTVKPAFRVVLEDGTELIASGDHRFLTGRGWKHVSGAEPGGARRPHLTLNSKLMGFGRFAPAPEVDDEYRRGYLCGMIRGGAFLDRADRPARRSRFALAELEALRRAREYLGRFTVEAAEVALAGGGGAIRSAQPGAFAAITEWPRSPTASWRKGFLAGIFDAEGSSTGPLRFANAAPAIIARICESLTAFGFDHVVEDRGLATGLRCVRLLGGLPERQRFLHTVDPAVTRKRSIEGAAVRSSARLRVVAVEPLAVELPMYDITTGTGDFVANGVISHNCFARPTHEYLDMNAGRDFEREIIVKVNVPEVLRAELARPSWRGDPVALGTNTDPYQWVEGRYKLMRGIWAALRDFRNPCSILTKSPLLLRDLDLLQEIAAVADVSACLSVPTLDERAWRATEPHTPNPRARLEAVGELNRAGIPTGILIAPLLPGINDDPEQVERIVELATEAGATYIGGTTLFLRGAVREIYFDWLREYRPDLVPRYERLYADGAYLSPAQRRKLELAAGAPWALKTYPERMRHRGVRREPERLRPAVRAIQGSLF